MKHRFFERYVAVVLVASLANTGVIAGGLSAPRQDRQAATWDRLLTLPEGTRLAVTFPNGAEITGRLVEARADAVVLEDYMVAKGQVTHSAGTSLKDRLTFLRSEVSSVRLLRREGGSKAVMWTAIGVAAGLFVWMSIYRALCECN